MLSETLKGCGSIVSNLNLRETQLDDECMKYLGDYIQNNEYLEILQIWANKITDQGVEVLSEYLIGNRSLKVLLMGGCVAITDASNHCFIDIAKGSCIIKIDLLYTSVSDDVRRQIDETLSIPIDQRQIPIKSNSKSAAKISKVILKQ